MIAILRKLVKTLWHSFLKIYAFLYSTNNSNIFFLPHRNSLLDDYDIINYSADNVLVLLNHFLHDENFVDNTLYIGYYKTELLDQYKQYVKAINKDLKVIWVNVNSKYQIAMTLIKCGFTFTDHPHYEFPYKSDKQKVISLGYFTPFKDDYWDIKKLNIRERNKLRTTINKSYDYHIVTSSISGRIISVDTLLEYDRFISLGFPRNDIFYMNNEKIKEKLRGVIDVNFDKIICYTPTYRDFERNDLYLRDKSMVERKGVFGYTTSELSQRMDELLEKSNAIVIAKMHPWQEKSVLDGNIGKRTFMFGDLAKQIRCSLYDVLSVTDILVTDYTSTAFDFMHRNKPIIYYFYDYEKYTKNRGFSFEPIETVCGGPIVFTYKDLISSIDEILAGKDEYAEKRENVHSIINEHHDGKSGLRIINLYKSKVNGKDKCSGYGL